MSSEVTDCAAVDEMLAWVAQIQPLLPNSSEDFADDPGRYGIASLLINLGEVAKRVSGEERRTMSDIPWKDIIGMRDVLAHKTANVDYNIVWRAVSSLSLIEAVLVGFKEERCR